MIIFKIIIKWGSVHNILYDNVIKVIFIDLQKLLILCIIISLYFFQIITLEHFGSTCKFNFILLNHNTTVFIHKLNTKTIRFN